MATGWHLMVFKCWTCCPRSACETVMDGHAIWTQVLSRVSLTEFVADTALRSLNECVSPTPRKNVKPNHDALRAQVSAGCMLSDGAD